MVEKTLSPSPRSWPNPGGPGDRLCCRRSARPKARSRQEKSMVFGWPNDDGSKPILLTAMEDIGLFNPLRLSSASDLHSRIKLLEDATRACRAELLRRPSQCQEPAVLVHPACAAISRADAVRPQ